MHRALIILCVLCTASLLVTVTAQPGRMRILPGLTFYNSDDSMGSGGTQSLNDEDRNLLNTVLKIISRPEMQRVLEDLQTTLQTQGENGNGNGLGNGYGNGNGNGYSNGNGNGNGYINGNGNGNGYGNGNGINGNGISDNEAYIDSSGSYPKPGNGNGNGGGLPIATINVYPGYPGGSQALTDASRRMVHFPKGADGAPDVAAEAYSDDNSASPIDNGYGVSRKYSYMGENMNEIKDVIHPYNADEVFANQNYPPPNDNYFDSNSNLQQILPALDRRSLSKLDQKEEFTNTQQLAEKLGQRRMMQYEKPNPGNHFSPFLFPTH